MTAPAWRPSGACLSANCPPRLRSSFTTAKRSGCSSCRKVPTRRCSSIPCGQVHHRERSTAWAQAALPCRRWLGGPRVTRSASERRSSSSQPRRRQTRGDPTRVRPLRIAPLSEGTLKHRVQRRIASMASRRSVGGRCRLPRLVHLGSELIGSAGYRSAGQRRQGISLSATR